jgi:hypothetical protein
VEGTATTFTEDIFVLVVFSGDGVSSYFIVGELECRRSGVEGGDVLG